jgi:hypothetical protein
MEVTLHFSGLAPFFGVMCTGVKGIQGLSLHAMVGERRIKFISCWVFADDVTADTLRGLRLGEIREEVLRQLRENPGGADMASRLIAEGLATEAELDAWAGRVGAVQAARATAVAAAESLRGTGRHRGRKPLSDEFLSDIARLYLAVLETDAGQVIKVMRDQLEANGHPASRNTVASWVRRAPPLPPEASQEVKQGRDSEVGSRRRSTANIASTSSRT